MATNDRHEPGTEVDARPENTVRRPWHPPQFVVADLSLTKASVHANTDGKKDAEDGTLS